MKRGSIVLMLTAALFVSGCATGSATQPLYGWGRYEAQVYQNLVANGSGPSEQIAILEADVQKLRGENASPAPGYLAHLGYLYLAVGDDAKALAAFEQEAAQFPEFVPYLQFLSKKKSQP